MAGLSYLLDANVISEPARRSPDPTILRRIQAHEAVIALPAPAVHEVRFGVLRLAPSRQRSELTAYLDRVIERQFPVLAYDLAAAEWHAGERARLVASGRTPPYLDGQIAAIAATNGLTLITRNVRDFAGFHGLVVEDWST
jgi:tRNA(fMet)-specific endonuclease VapC